MSKGRKTLVSVAQTVGFASKVLVGATKKAKDPELRILAIELARWVQRARRVAGIDQEPVETGRARRLIDDR